MKTLFAIFLLSIASLAQTASIPVQGLPSGLSVTPQGQIVGIPTLPGTFQFQVQACDAEVPAVCATSVQLQIVVSCAVAVGTTILPNGGQGLLYSQSLSATGCVPPYAWSVK